MEWYYIGHYGQLGPLTREQVDELIASSVIERDTYVWRVGMAQWQQAGAIQDLALTFRSNATFGDPPPPPPPNFSKGPGVQTGAPSQNPFAAAAPPVQPTQFISNYNYAYPALRSDKSRVAAGILQIIFPGIGRMYLGYMAIGVLQLLLTICSFGVLHIWSIIDGIIILSGGLNMDGYGRQLKD